MKIEKGRFLVVWSLGGYRPKEVLSVTPKQIRVASYHDYRDRTKKTRGYSVAKQCEVRCVALTWDEADAISNRLNEVRDLHLKGPVAEAKRVLREANERMSKAINKVSDQYPVEFPE